MILAFVKTNYKTFDLLGSFPSHNHTMIEIGNNFRKDLDDKEDFREVIVFKLGLGGGKLSIPSAVVVLLTEEQKIEILKDQLRKNMNL